jgi:catechol 2,3-dioxygenase-like lactoylglutathione lyase family enzyme
MESRRIRITGIHHVQLAIPPSGEDDARSFYGNLLGLRETEKPAALATKGGCWFEGPGVSVHLGVEDSFSPARKAHLAFVVENLDHAERALSEVSATITFDASLPGARRLYTADPFGNRIELIEENPRGRG